MCSPDPRCRPDENNGACHSDDARIGPSGPRASGNSRCERSLQPVVVGSSASAPRDVAVEHDQQPMRVQPARVGHEAAVRGSRVEAEVLRRKSRAVPVHVIVIAGNRERRGAVRAPGRLVATGERRRVGVSDTPCRPAPARSRPRGIESRSAGRRRLRRLELAAVRNVARGVDPRDVSPVPHSPVARTRRDASVRAHRARRRRRAARTQALRRAACALSGALQARANRSRCQP